MEELIKGAFGVFVLILGFFLGGYLSKVTKEELKSGQKWFKLIILISLFFGFYGLFVQNDFLLFSFLFIAIVTSRSLLGKKKVSPRVKKIEKLKN